MKKIALITGVSKGIGKALAEKLAQENYFVIGTSRSGKIDGFERENFYPIILDISKLEGVKNAKKEIFGKFDYIDLLINNAGIGPDLYTDQPDLDSFHHTFDVNVKGTVFLLNLL